MKLKQYACIVLIGALLTATQAAAAPLSFFSFRGYQRVQRGRWPGEGADGSWLPGFRGGSRVVPACARQMGQ